MTQEEGERLNELELIALLTEMIEAGHDTTACLISSGVLALMRHRDQWDRLCANPLLAAQATEEILRCYSPVHMALVRVPVENLEIGGCPINAGEVVIANWAAANRDPAVFDAPDAFDIGRSENRHLSFGFGEHFCLGANLKAAAEVKRCCACWQRDFRISGLRQRSLNGGHMASSAVQRKWSWRLDSSNLMDGCIEAMFDTAEVASLIAKKFLVFDSQDMSRFLECFSEDVKFDITTFKGRRVLLEGKAEVEEFCSRLVEGRTDLLHVAGVVLVESRGEGKAEATYYGTYITPGDALRLAGIGWYREELRREENGWRITHMDHKELSPVLSQTSID